MFACGFTFFFSSSAFHLQDIRESVRVLGWHLSIVNSKPPASCSLVNPSADINFSVTSLSVSPLNSVIFFCPKPALFRISFSEDVGILFLLTEYKEKNWRVHPLLLFFLLLSCPVAEKERDLLPLERLDPNPNGRALSLWRLNASS